MSPAPLTPASLALWCAEQQDDAAAARLIDAFDDVPMPTQLCVIGYILAVIEQQAPQPDLVLPALAEIVRVTTAALATFRGTPGGQA